MEKCMDLGENKVWIPNIRQKSTRDFGKMTRCTAMGGTYREVDLTTLDNGKIIKGTVTES